MFGVYLSTLLIRFNIGIEILAKIRFAHVIISNKCHSKHFLSPDIHFHFVYVSCSLQMPHASSFHHLFTPPIANTTQIYSNLNPQRRLMVAFFKHIFMSALHLFMTLAEHNDSESFLSFELVASIKGQTIAMALAMKMSCFDLILGRVIVCFLSASVVLDKKNFCKCHLSRLMINVFFFAHPL